jgi:hypothetical protein
MMNTEPTAIERATIELWLPENLLEIVKGFESWHLAATSLPDGVGRSRGIKVSKIDSIDLGSMRLLSLAQSRVRVAVGARVGLSVYLSADDVESSEEAREWVGEVEPGFVGAYLDFDTRFTIKLEVELLKEPPMVLSYKLTGIDGISTIQIKD